MKLTLFVAFTCAMLMSVAQAETTLIKSSNFTDFQGNYCDASGEIEHILIVPAALFEENTNLTCGDVTTKIYMSESKDDPGHILYNVDPLPGVSNSLDCDGKADEGMVVIALNCLPADHESKSHKKN